MRQNPELVALDSRFAGMTKENKARSIEPPGIGRRSSDIFLRIYRCERAEMPPFPMQARSILEIGAPAPRPAFQMPLGAPPPPLHLRDAAQPADGRRRTRIWELASYLHCSIVGTCLSTGELRQVLPKAGLPSTAPPTTICTARAYCWPTCAMVGASCCTRHSTSAIASSSAASRRPRRSTSSWFVARRRQAGRHSGRLLGGAHPSGHQRRADPRSSAKSTCFPIWWARPIGPTSGA